MSWADIRTATKLKLQTVSGVENVLDYVVWTDDWEYIMNTFVKDGRVNTWMIGLGNNNINTLERDYKKHTYAINIFAYYSLKTSNESSKTFEDIVMNVRDEFMESFNYIKTFVPAYSNSAITKSPSLIVVDNTVFLQHACHRCQIQIQVDETITGSLACNG